MSHQFPAGFWWGTATSAYQIEGAVESDGRVPSIWDEFCRVPGAVHGGEDGKVAIDHYHRHAEDVALMSGLGLDMYRFSVSWPRVLDGERINQAGMDFYSRLVDDLLGAGIQPWLTLYHWDLPASLEGGWTSRDTAKRFAEYAVAVHDRLGDRVRIWTTLNEPWCSAFLGYGSGEHAPGRRDPVAAVRSAHHLLLGHGLAVEALREADPGASLGITVNIMPALPASSSEADLDVVRRLDGTCQRIFLDPLFTGVYPGDVVEDLAQWWPDELVADGDLSLISAPIDLLGINYYSTTLYRAAGAQELASGTDPGHPVSPHLSAPDAVAVSRGLPRTAMGWEIDPGGLREALTRVHDSYTAARGTALVVTENGAAFDDQVLLDGHVLDEDRISYLNDHLVACAEAIDAGVDLRGYLVWSLIDNFEWSFGYSRRFGIVSVDEQLRRIPKASAQWYSAVIAGDGEGLGGRGT